MSYRPIGVISLFITTIATCADWNPPLHEGRRLRNQRNLPAALRAYQDAVNIATNTGEEPLTIASLRCERGSALSEAGKTSAAIDEMVTAMRTIRISGEPIPVAVCAYHLATHYQNAGKYWESRDLYREAMAIEEKLPGREIQLARVLVSLADLSTLEGLVEEADKHARSAFRIVEQNPNVTDSDRASTYAMLALTSRGLLRHTESLKYAEREVVLRRRTGLAGSDELIRALCLLAATNAELKRFSKAEEWIRQAQLTLSDLPPDHTSLRAKVVLTAAHVANHGKDLRKAERLFDEARALLETQPDTHRLEVASIWTHLGRTRNRLGNYSGAEHCHSAALGALKDNVPDSHPFIAFAWLDLADTYRLMQRYDDAVAHYRKGLALAEQFAGRGSSSLAVAYYMLGKILEKRKAKAEAREYLALAEKAKAAGGPARAMGFTIDVDDLGRKRR